MTEKIIVSLTTIPSRIGILQIALDNLKQMEWFDKVFKIVLNVDDNVSDEMRKRYDTFKDFNVEVKYRDHKWRSCNKLIWTYKENPDAVIVTFDDDKIYPKDSLRQLLEKHEEYPDCIISQEINPIIKTEYGIAYLNTFDIKLDQIQYGTYLSNECLFPLNCFDEDTLFDFEKYEYIFNCCHDEKWFWVASTLKGTKVIGLSNTFSRACDSIQIKGDYETLSDINGNQDTISGYNRRLSECYGERLLKILDNNPIVFNIDDPYKVNALIGNMRLLVSVYQCWPIKISFGKDLALSWRFYLKNVLKPFKNIKFED